MGNTFFHQNSTFEGKPDRYDGILVDSSMEPCRCQREFRAKLLRSLSQWKCDKKRGIWFKIHLKHSKWIAILAANGFVYHHAQESYVMMTQWLPKDEPCNIPNYPHNFIGVGAFVVNDSNEVLVVKERYAVQAHWKLPGGYVEWGEHLSEAAVREVSEETGVAAEFVSVIAFRHVHRLQFNCSDVYFVCHLRPTTTAIHKCERELAECRWMALEDYCNESQVNEVNRYLARTFTNHLESGATTRLSPVVIESSGHSQSVYILNRAD